MSLFSGFFKGISALLVSLLAFGIFRTEAAPTAAFTMYPDGNPVVGQTVQFTDTSSGGPTTWAWDFGDGQGSTQQNPAHVYGGPGTFQVTLTAGNGSGSSQPLVQPVIVTATDTLQLNNKGAHPFTVKLVATNQHASPAVQGPGQAIPQNDLFGYFSLPSLTNNPSNPEVFVKILDGRVINGQFWVFYGHLTDLIYDLSVTEVETGLVKTYHKDAGAQAPGDADTSGFHPSPTPTPTPSSTPTPTPTPTPAPAITVNLVASNSSTPSSFMWSFNGGGPTFTFHVGQAYTVNISKASGSSSHVFSGAAGICNATGLSTTPVVCNFTPTSAQIGDHFFGCSNSGCGSGHSNMQNGDFIVAP